MTKQHNALVPEALGQRPDLNHNRYDASGTPLDLDGVGVSFGTPTKAHTYQAPTGDGVTSRRLRRFALVLSRFQLPDTKQQAKRWKLKPTSVRYAENIIATNAYEEAFSDDPTIDTLNVDVLALMLSEPSPNPELIAKALSYSGTRAMDNLLEKIKNRVVADTLANTNRAINGAWGIGTWRYRKAIQINSDHPYYRKQAKREYKDLARFIETESMSDAKEIKASEKAKDEVQGYRYDKGKAGYGDGTDNWYPLFVSKPDLPLTHTGKLGRRIMYTDTGRSVKNIGRLYSDPEQRIFTRKTRSLGAVVVIDCSGSMSLDDSDIDEMIGVSAGATVLCYSSGGSPSPNEPNAYIVARRGRKIRQLPNWEGGNGCDAPALMYGIKELRESSRQPVIWISDEQVTGRRDIQNKILREETDKIKKKYGVIVCRTPYKAITKLKQLQGKG